MFITPFLFGKVVLILFDLPQNLPAQLWSSNKMTSREGPGKSGGPKIHPLLLGHSWERLPP